MADAATGGKKGQVVQVPTIQVSPDVLDKALAVMVDEHRAVLAVWKGRARIDLHDVAGTWHETTQAYPRAEEGLWSRDDIRQLMSAALRACSPPRVRVAANGDGLRVDVEALCRASLVRATAGGYALWGGGTTLTVHGADGALLRTVRVPAGDLPTMSQLMFDMLELSELVGRRDEADVAPAPAARGDVAPVVPPAAPPRLSAGA